MSIALSRFRRVSSQAKRSVFLCTVPAQSTEHTITWQNSASSPRGRRKAQNVYALYMNYQPPIRPYVRQYSHHTSAHGFAVRALVLALTWSVFRYIIKHADVHACIQTLHVSLSFFVLVAISTPPPPLLLRTLSKRLMATTEIIFIRLYCSVTWNVSGQINSNFLQLTTEQCYLAGLRRSLDMRFVACVLSIH